MLFVKFLLKGHERIVDLSIIHESKEYIIKFINIYSVNVIEN